MNSISCTTEVYVEYKLFWYRLVCTVLVKLHVPSRSNLADGLCLFSYSSYHMNLIGHRWKWAVELPATASRVGEAGGRKRTHIHHHRGNQEG